MGANRDRLLNALLGFALFAAAIPTLIAYRAFLQPKYHWGLLGVTGQGITPGLSVIVGAALLAWAAVVFGSLRTRATGPLLVALNAVWLAAVCWGAIRLGPRMTMRGDAWGMRLDVSVLAPLLFAALLLLSLWWWWRHRGAARPLAMPRLSRTQRALLWCALALLPIIAVLFALGDGMRHTWMDRTAVVCVIAQCLLVGAALRNQPM